MKSLALAAACCILMSTTLSPAVIYNWQTGEIIPGTESITPGPGLDPSYWNFDLSDWNTDTHNLKYASLSSLDLRRNSLSSSWFDYADFRGSDLTGTWFWGATVTGADFTDAVVREVYFVDMTGFTKEQFYSTASYKSRDLAGIGLPSHDLAGWDLHLQNLAGAWFYSANLTGTTFAGANLADAGFDEAILAGTDFTDAVVTAARFEDTTASGFTKEQLYSTASYKNMDLSGIALGANDMASWDFHGQNLTMADFSTVLGNGSDLTAATFVGADLTDASFSHADLTDADLTGVDLTRTGLRNTNLTGAVLVGANLAYTDFTFADLTSTDLSGQRLADADFDYAKMIGTNLTDASLTNTALYGVDVTNANFTGADVRGMNLFQTAGFTKEQLYSTASYNNRDLSGISLQDHDLSAWDFHSQSLRDAYLAFTNLTGADFTGADLTNAALYSADLADTDFADAVINGARFGSMTGNNLSREQLYSTASYKSRDLGGVAFAPCADLSGWDLHGQDLTGAVFKETYIEGADLTDAVVKRVDLSSTTHVFAPGFTREQLYSTASYKSRDMGGIGLSGNTLSGWNFTGQSLITSSFAACHLDGADFTLADMRGADLTNAIGTFITRNTIWTDGTIAGLQLTSGEELWIHNYDMAITANDSWTMTSGAVLKMVLEGNWLSVMNVSDGVTPDLGGTLELSFAGGINIAPLIGTEFKLFNWNGRLAAGDCFDFIATTPGTAWDTSRLYTEGVVTLVPEPVSLSLLTLGTLLLRRRKRGTGFQPVFLAAPRSRSSSCATHAFLRLFSFLLFSMKNDTMYLFRSGPALSAAIPGLWYNGWGYIDYS